MAGVQHDAMLLGRRQFLTSAAEGAPAAKGRCASHANLRIAYRGIQVTGRRKQLFGLYQATGIVGGYIA